MPERPGPKPRVFIVDDHPMVREGLRSMLGDAVTLCGEAGTGAEALSRIAQLRADLVLLDLELPDVDGLTLIPRLRAASPSTVVLVISMHDRPEFVRQALQAGAAGYLLKGTTRKELLAAVHAAREGGSVIEPQLLKRLLAEQATPAASPGGGGGEALTVVERDVLALVTRGLTNKEIAKQLRWSVGNVKKYVQRILEKLDVSDRTQAAAEAVRRGLVEHGPASPPSGRP